MVEADEVWLVGADRVERVDVTSSDVVASAALGTEDWVASLQSLPTGTSPAAPPQHAVDPTPWVLLGLGGACVVAGAVLVGVGAGDFDATAAPHPDELHYGTALSRQNAADLMIGIGAALGGVGLALAATGLGLGLGATSSTGEVSLRFGPASAALFGRF
jgi:hypothetical protein